MDDAMKPPPEQHVQIERPRPRMEVEKELRHLADAREAGLVTEEEFRERRLHLLSRSL